MTMETLRSNLVVPAALAVSLVLAACSQPPVPQDRYYRLDVPQAASTGTILPGTLQMEPFITEGLTAGRAIIYVASESSTTMQEYNYDFWAEPPATMLRDELMAYLRDAGVADNIVVPETRAEADYIFSGRIDRLELIKGPEPKAFVELEMAVTRESGGTVILVRSYDVTVEASDATVRAGVDAANRAITTIFQQFLSDLRDS